MLVDFASHDWNISSEIVFIELCKRTLVLRCVQLARERPRTLEFITDILFAVELEISAGSVSLSNMGFVSRISEASPIENFNKEGVLSCSQ